MPLRIREEVQLWNSDRPTKEITLRQPLVNIKDFDLSVSHRHNHHHRSHHRYRSRLWKLSSPISSKHQQQSRHALFRVLSLTLSIPFSSGINRSHSGSHVLPSSDWILQSQGIGLFPFTFGDQKGDRNKRWVHCIDRQTTARRGDYTQTQSESIEGLTWIHGPRGKKVRKENRFSPDRSLQKHNSSNNIVFRIFLSKFRLEDTFENSPIHLVGVQI